MKIHRLRLTDFKGVRDCEVTFAERGVTIIEGDNEIGKTSLVEAIDLLLSARDDSRHRLVRDAKPVDRDVGAEVEAEISTGPYRFVYRKRWHKKPLTELQVHTPSPEQHTGREAHDRVDALLAETLDPQLWNALRVEQGTELSQSHLGDCDSLSRALDAAAGGDATGEADDTLWERIVAERERYWTPAGKPRSDRVERAERLTRLGEQADELRAQLAGLDRDAEEVARLTRELDDLTGRLEQARATEAELAGRSRQVEQLRGRVKELAARVDAATAERDRRRTELDARRELGERLDRRATELAELDTSLERARPAGDAARRRHDELEHQVTAARDAADAAEAALGRATADAEHLRHLIEVEQLRERRDRVVAAQRTLDAAESTLEAATVDAEVLARIDAANLEVEKARAVLHSGAARLDATALAPVDLTVADEAVHLDTGDTHGVTVGDAISVTIPGLIELQLRAGDDAKGLGDALGRAESELERQLAAAGADDVAAAHTALAVRTQTERAIDDARRTIDQDLRDLTLESLQSKVTRLDERIASFSVGRAADPPLPHDHDTAEALVASLTVEHQARRRELAGLEAEQREAVSAGERSRTDLAELGARRGIVANDVDELTRELERARESEPDEKVERAVRDATDRLAAVEGELDSAREELAAADPDSVDELLVNARAVLRRVDEDHMTCDHRQRELLVRLEVHGEQGIAEQLDTTSTELERLRQDHERVEARAAAADLLHDTFRTRRDEARSRYLAPFTDRIERLGRLVYGPGFAVGLDDDLRIERRTLDGVTVDFDQLSVGAREQLGILSRLACASIVSADGGAPVVVDDALGWSDPGRAERMGAALAVAGRDCQVIVLTCTPGRYSGVGEATVVRLPN